MGVRKAITVRDGPLDNRADTISYPSLIQKAVAAPCMQLD